MKGVLNFGVGLIFLECFVFIGVISKPQHELSETSLEFEFITSGLPFVFILFISPNDSIFDLLNAAQMCSKIIELEDSNDAIF